MEIYRAQMLCGKIPLTNIACLPPPTKGTRVCLPFNFSHLVLKVFPSFISSRAWVCESSGHESGIALSCPTPWIGSQNLKYVNCALLRHIEIQCSQSSQQDIAIKDCDTYTLNIVMLVQKSTIKLTTEERKCVSRLKSLCNMFLLKKWVDIPMFPGRKSQKNILWR